MHLEQVSAQGSVMMGSERCRCICCRCLTPPRSLVSEQHPPLTNPSLVLSLHWGRHRLAPNWASQVGVAQAGRSECPSRPCQQHGGGLESKSCGEKKLLRNSAPSGGTTGSRSAC